MSRSVRLTSRAVVTGVVSTRHERLLRSSLRACPVSLMNRSCWWTAPSHRRSESSRH